MTMNNNMYLQMMKDTLYYMPSTNNTVELRLVMKQTLGHVTNRINDDDDIAMAIVFSPHVTDIIRDNVLMRVDI